MHTLSEVDYCNLHSMSFLDLQAHRAKFNRFYPNQIEMDIPTDQYEEAMDWLEATFGGEDDEDFPNHNGEAEWSRYHPTTADMCREEGSFTSSTFGFKTAQQALLFKLRWWN